MSLPDAERERDGESCKNKVCSFLYFPENPTRPRETGGTRASAAPSLFAFGSFSQTRVVPGFSAAREPLVIDKSANVTSRPGSTRGWSFSGVMAVEGRRRPLFTAHGVRNRPGPRPKNARSIRISAETLFRFRVAESKEKNGAFSRGVVVRSGLAGTTRARRRPRDARPSRSEPRWPTPGLSPWVRKAAGVQALPRRYVAKRLGTTRPIDSLFPDVPISDTWRFSPRWMRARVDDDRRRVIRSRGVF